jgi:hypothetical protein
VVAGTRSAGSALYSVRSFGEGSPSHCVGGHVQCAVLNSLLVGMCSASQIDGGHDR